MAMNIKLLVLVLLGACLQSVTGSKNHKKKNNGGRLMNIGKFGLGLLSLNYATSTENANVDCAGQSMDFIKAADFGCGWDYNFFKYGQLWHKKKDDSWWCSCIKNCEESNECVAISFSDKVDSWKSCELHNKIGERYHNDPTIASIYQTEMLDNNYKCYHVLRHCPASLPPNALVMMDYIRCSDEPNDFLSKFLTSEENVQPCNTIQALYQRVQEFVGTGKSLTPEKNVQPCSKMQTLYQNAQKLGKCISKGSAEIVKSAKAQIFGRNVSHKIHVTMFEDYLGNFENMEINEALELHEIFEKIKDIDFFRVKAAVDVSGKLRNAENTAKRIKWILKNYETLKEYNFDRVEYVANLLKPLVQNTDENLSFENQAYVYEQAYQQWIQREPLENIKEVIKYAETAQNKKLTWEIKTNQIKKKYDL